ncbi:concanavalin A-like lectin/glucanase domain-containing protein [Xylaria intraflava]|nr:concanavalin A-like lectin/glucanase domain-containing protein [Xylaria intraflava]
MTMTKFGGLLTTLGLAAQLVGGQLQPNCNPLHSHCPEKKALPHDNYYIDFTKETGPPEHWVIANHEVVNFTPKGAEFTYNKKGDTPNMWTDFHMLGGRYDVVMQIAPGQGIISNLALWSDIQDEIDWEFSGNQHGSMPFPPPDGMWTAQTNFFVRGKMWDEGVTYERAAYKPTTQFHTYSVDWDDGHITWSVDGTVIRSLYDVEDSYVKDSQDVFPQTPMKLQLGLWGGGDPDNNPSTIKWAGGEIDMKGVPYTMYVRSVNITNKYPACQYKYKNKLQTRIYYKSLFILELTSTIEYWGFIKQCISI